ncbi:MAG: hypothetical protein U0528_09200 [Anaerolineae bacterium]
MALSAVRASGQTEIAVLLCRVVEVVPATALGSQIYELSRGCRCRVQFSRQHPQTDLADQTHGDEQQRLGPFTSFSKRYPDVMWIINLSAAGVLRHDKDWCAAWQTSRQAGATWIQLRFGVVLAKSWYWLCDWVRYGQEVEAALTRLQQEPQWRSAARYGRRLAAGCGIDEIKREYRGAYGVMVASIRSHTLILLPDPVPVGRKR